ncbi:MAG: hypothetical protein IJS90_01005, partial [Clostridia bacterium]|nr:hypothetical protein [Clostridia bacterium]
TCSRCDYTTYAAIPASGHTWGEWANTTAPTCTVDGEDTRECSVCHATETRVAAATGHTPAAAVTENAVAPNCTEAGSHDEVVYCSVCNAEISRNTVTDAALGHDLVHHAAQAATCTEAGWNAYDTCSRCDYTTYSAIPANGHTPAAAVNENAVAPNCTEAGSHDEVVYCSVCNAELSRDSVTDAALGHDLVHHEAQAATCTEAGWNAYDTCSRCDYTTYEAIPATGHSFTNYVSDNNATCLEDGTKTAKCDRCDATDTITDEGSATGHTPGETVIENTVDPTCVLAGSHDEVVYCSVCTAELSRDHVTDKATGHAWGEPSYVWAADNASVTATRVCANNEEHVESETAAATYSVVTASTCAAVGAGKYTSAAFTNEAFSVQTKDVEIAKLPHTPGEEVQENYIAPTYDAEGSYDVVVYCSECGEELSRVSVPVARLSDITVEDDPSGVNVTYRSDSFDGTAALVVLKILEAAEVSEVNELLPAGFYKDVVYEIHMEVNGVETQPKNAVTVRVPIPEGYIAEEITIYHIADDNTVSEIEFVAAEGMLIFTTDSFSNYAVCATHTPAEAVRENEVAATCSSDGSYDSVVYCSVCEAELSRDPVNVPSDPDAHVWGEWAVSTPGTCTEDGVEIRFCEKDHNHFETKISVAPGHSWGEWITVLEPSPTADGLERRTCLRCGDTEERSIYYASEKTRQVQFVPIDDMHFLVHMDDADYIIRSKTAKAVKWYPNIALNFEVVTGLGWKHDGYEVRVNGQKLEPNADGTFTLPAGGDYAQINVYPVSEAASTVIPNESVCSYCGKVHPSHLWGRIVALFHAILYFLKNLFK